MEPLMIILGAAAIAIGSGIGNSKKTEADDKDKEKLNDLFKTVKLCNKKDEPEYAYVKWVQEYNSYKIFGIEVPVGCDVNQLLKLDSAIENVFKNYVEILYDNQNYRVKVYTGKLKPGKDYPFSVNRVPDKNHLYITVGMSLDGPIQVNLTDTLPSILLAGTAGAGKSRLVKSIICQLLENYTDKELKLLYLDNKGGVEAAAFKDTKHLISRSRCAEESILHLQEVKKEMFKRLELIESKNVTNIIDYNNQVTPSKKIPFLFVVVDELFSFSSLPSSPSKRKDATYEERTFNQQTAYRTMAEIASMCRAAGIHLLLCTQKPTSEVIPTSITCNCGLRIGLRTVNKQESRNIIENDGLEIIDADHKGAGIIKIDKEIRFQSFWITDEMVKNICDKHKCTKRNSEIKGNNIHAPKTIKEVEEENLVNFAYAD